MGSPYLSPLRLVPLWIPPALSSYRSSSLIDYLGSSLAAILASVVVGAPLDALRGFNIKCPGDGFRGTLAYHHTPPPLTPASLNFVRCFLGPSRATQAFLVPACISSTLVPTWWYLDICLYLATAPTAAAAAPAAATATAQSLFHTPSCLTAAIMVRDSLSPVGGKLHGLYH